MHLQVTTCNSKAENFPLSMAFSYPQIVTSAEVRLMLANLCSDYHKAPAASPFVVKRASKSHLDR